MRGSLVYFSRRWLCLALFLFLFAKRFFCRWQQRRRPPEVAQEFGLSLRTVQRLFVRFEQYGAAGIVPSYRPGRCPFATEAALVEAVCQTRREHPRWGAEMIRLDLEADSAALPCARTLQRHLRKAGLQPAPAGRPPRSAGLIPRADRPHQGWQMDAAEELRLQQGYACWLRIVDECSGAFLQTLIFACRRWEHVERHQVQDGLRQVFVRWGLPQRLRIDNGFPWGSSGDFPPELALWLLGLGIELVWIPPACPQQNGVVERAQGTGKNWTEPHTCRDGGELQRRCDDMDRRQRERYPYQDRHSRWEVYPELKHSGRKYSRAWERRHWDLSQVLANVAERIAVRQVDRSGSISLYHRTRYVGKPHIGQQVYVSLDPTGPTWVIADAEGRELRTHAAAELTRQRICSLSVACRKGKQS